MESDFVGSSWVCLLSGPYELATYWCKTGKHQQNRFRGGVYAVRLLHLLLHFEAQSHNSEHCVYLSLFLGFTVVQIIYFPSFM